VQTNGRFKDMGCRKILVTLYRKGLINLPVGKHDGWKENCDRKICREWVEMKNCGLKMD
jgi:hypothetical protein